MVVDVLFWLMDAPAGGMMGRRSGASFIWFFNGSLVPATVVILILGAGQTNSGSFSGHFRSIAQQRQWRPLAHLGPAWMREGDDA